MLAVLAVIGVFLVIGYGVTKAQGERELSRAYLDVAYQVTTTEASLAAALADVVANVESYNRATLVERLSRMENDAEAALDAITAIEPPAGLVDAASFLRIAVSAWRSGVSETRAGLLALSSNPLDEAGLASLEGGLLDLRVGDRAYRGFLSEIGQVDTELQGGPLPSVSFVPTAESTRYDPRDLARRMFVAGTIGPVDDVAVADLKLEPGPVALRDGLPVLAVTGAQSAAVTITNRGNVAVTGVTVRLSLVSNTGQSHQEDQDVSSMEAGTSRQVLFTGLPVERGVIYEITVAVTRPDSNAENDQVKLLFQVNPDG